MARYKLIDTSPRFIAVDLQRQLLPGSFEHALNHLIDHELNLSSFDTRYKNDLTGAAAYQNGANCNHKGLIGTKFQGALRDCVPCALREKCLRTPEKTQTRQVMFFRGRAERGEE